MTVRNRYEKIFEYVSYVVNDLQKTDWNDFSEGEKIATQDVVLLVGLLYKMCRVSLVNKAATDKDMNTVNYSEINESMNAADSVLSNL